MISNWKKRDVINKLLCESTFAISSMLKHKYDWCWTEYTHSSQKWQTEVIYCSTVSFSSEMYFGHVRSSFDPWYSQQTIWNIWWQIFYWNVCVDINGSASIFSLEKLMLCYCHLLEKQRTMKRVFMTLGYFPTYIAQSAYSRHDMKYFIVRALCLSIQSH